MTFAQVKVVTPEGFVIDYRDPPSFICVHLDACTGWRAAAIITWSNIPSSKNVHFYTSDTCNATRGYSFTTVLGDAKGTYKFDPTQPIRAIMVEDHTISSHPPLGHTLKCHKGYLLNRMTEREATENNNSSDVQDVSLSSNWFYRLPDS